MCVACIKQQPPYRFDTKHYIRQPAIDIASHRRHILVSNSVLHTHTLTCRISFALNLNFIHDPGQDSRAAQQARNFRIEEKKNFNR